MAACVCHPRHCTDSALNSQINMNEHDLPLTANTKDILVTHFILDLECHFDAKVMRGHVMLFLDPSPHPGTCRQVFSTQEYQAGLQRSASRVSENRKHEKNLTSSPISYSSSSSSGNLPETDLLHPGKTENSNNSNADNVSMHSANSVENTHDYIEHNYSAAEIQIVNHAQEVQIGPQNTVSENIFEGDSSHLDEDWFQLNRVENRHDYSEQNSSAAEVPIVDQKSCEENSQHFHEDWYKINRVENSHNYSEHNSSGAEVHIVHHPQEVQLGSQNTVTQNICEEDSLHFHEGWFQLKKVESSHDYSEQNSSAAEVHVVHLPQEVQIGTQNTVTQSIWEEYSQDLDKGWFQLDGVENSHNYREQNSSAAEVQVVGHLQEAQIGSQNAVIQNCCEKDSLQESQIRLQSTVTQNRREVPSPNLDEDWFQLILDCKDLQVTRAEEVVLPVQLSQQLQACQLYSLSQNQDLYLQCHTCKERRPLCFSTNNWSLKLWKQGVRCASEFPRVVCIHYATVPHGESLRWAKDQDDRPCVYSASMWINNRALFPCQEFGALATWQVFISSPEGTAVVVSGDIASQPDVLPNGWLRWYQENSLPLPSFCLALAVGYWESCQLYPNNKTSEEHSWIPECPCSHEHACHGRWSETAVLPCRLFAPASLMPQALAEMQDYYWRSCAAVQRLLGAYPFPHVDFLIIPACSQDMAMANPGLIFLSQSLLSGDGSMLIRLGHELSHGWFGLLIGARDWTEEWLSEGFATYVEDAIHANAMQWEEGQRRDHAELRAVLRHRVLQAEMATTMEQLQTLRPNQGDPHCSGSDVTHVKNGLNPFKLFTQVHYLKGYFLLRHLETQVGIKRFQEGIWEHIKKHHGELILSKDFLELLFVKFPELSAAGLSLEQIYKNWLDSAGMPKDLESFSASPENIMVKVVYREVSLWNKYDATHRRKRKRRKKIKLSSEDELSPQVGHLQADQLVLLLEELLTEDKLMHKTLGRINAAYSISSRNADVKHRWCELVCKHHYQQAYKDLENFLINHQAMGVYLYGEMVLSGCKKQKMLAEQCFAQVSSEMEKGTRRTVHSMLYGAPD